METLGRVRARGDTDFAVSDFDSMPYLLAFGKVCPELVYHLTGADSFIPRTGNLEGLPGRDRNPASRQGRQCPATFKTRRRSFWKGI